MLSWPEVPEEVGGAADFHHVLLLVTQGLEVARQGVLPIRKHQEHQRRVETTYILLKETIGTLYKNMQLVIFSTFKLYLSTYR